MKKFKYILFFAGLAVSTVVVSCDDDVEKYSGTPVGNQSIETLQGDITIDPSIISVLTNQKIPFTIGLPRTFADTVTVEVSTLNKSGGRTRVYVDFLPGEDQKSYEIPAAGGAIFDSTMDVYLSGIALKHTEVGKHYLIKSDTITLNTGNTSVPTDDNKKLQMRFAWFNPSQTRNNLRVFVDRTNVDNWVSGVGASNSTSGGVTTITVASTAGLQVGMSVQVSSGRGLFPVNTVVLSIPSATTFTVSNTPVGATNALGANTVITAGGNDFILNQASSGSGLPNQDPKNIITLQTGTTAGLTKGMTVTVTSGDATGKFRPGTTIEEIISPTKFRISTNAGPLNTLANATIAVAIPDVIPAFPGGAVDHAITNLLGPISAGISSLPGDYTIKFNPISVAQSGADIRYRIVWKYPDGSTGFTDGVFENATTDSPSQDVLKVTKSASGPTATYIVTPL